MQRVRISDLQKASIDRPAGYFDEVMGQGRQEGGFLLLEDESYGALLKKYSGWRARPAPAGPGTLLSILIQQLTGKQSADCSACSARANQMNAWGWIGCWRERATIAQWLMEEAGKLGHKTDENTVLVLLTAVIGEKLKPH
jgi:hypothetical protein